VRCILSPSEATDLIAEIAADAKYAGIIDSLCHLAITTEGRVSDADIGKMLRDRLSEIDEMIRERARESA
jgi:hypothetical protein